MELTYSQLFARARGVARELERRGVERGDRVAVFLGNGPEFVTAYLALLRLGAVLLPVNLAYRQREIAHILEDARPRLILSAAAQRPLLAASVPESWPPGAFDTAWVAAEEVAEWPAVSAAEARAASGGGAAAQAPTALPASGPPAGAPGAVGGLDQVTAPVAASGGAAPPLDGDDLALLLYTSGTTGRSKGAMITHNNVLATVTGLLAAWDWRPEDVLLLALPLFHVHGLLVGLTCALAAGATVELRARFDAAATAGDLEGGGVTLFFGVPTMYVRLVDELRRRAGGSAPEPAGFAGRPPLAAAAATSQPAVSAGAGSDRHPPGAHSPLRLFCSGSAPLSAETFAAFRELTGHAILERYGMTETGMILSNPYAGERRPGEVGTPLPGVSVRIVDAADRDLPDGAEGEILVRGANVFAGYWQAPGKTAESFTTDALGRRWFRTGDLARRDPTTGSITLLGRRHELILCGGFNIYPREVEEVLLTFPGIREAAVAGRPDPEWGEVPIAFLVADSPPDAEALNTLCRSQLASFKVPRAFHFLDSLPRNALGKLQKHLLPH